MDNPFNSMTGICAQCKHFKVLKFRHNTCSYLCFIATLVKLNYKPAIDQNYKPAIDQKKLVDTIKMNELESNVREYLTKFYKPISKQ